MIDESVHYTVEKFMKISDEGEWWFDPGSYPGSYLRAPLRTLEDAQFRAEEIKAGSNTAKVRIKKVVTVENIVQEY